jgi:hypothetical protein
MQGFKQRRHPALPSQGSGPQSSGDGSAVYRFVLSAADFLASPDA